MMWRTCVVMFFLVVLLFAAKSVLACKGDQIVFEDSFATLDPSWGDASDKLSVSNGKLTIRPEAAKRYQSINQGTVLQDMDACVKVSLASSEDPSWGGGFIFWASDYNNYYWLAVSGNGWFTVQRRSNGQDSASVAWTESAAVKKGVGQWNSLRVVTKGAQATIYINDVQVATFQGQPPQGGGMIGVYGDSPDKVPNTWEFSELKITNVVGVPSQVNVVPSPVAPTGSECQGEVIYEDNFATMDPAWGEPDEKVSVNNGKMVIQPAVNSGWSVLNQGNIFQDMQVCVK
ncbi:MAG TPA: family 16 glycoside hydrolase, partial [Thermodesulfobacteriota bacterium]|nr:family 16 glycoside hydrolase [Thermodesulfobacteriota bacterium]